MVASYPPRDGGWPLPESLRAWTLSEWLSLNASPGWVAGELAPSEVAALRAAGFLVAPPSARVRRASVLIDLARAVPEKDRLPLAALVPAYLGRGPG